MLFVDGKRIDLTSDSFYAEEYRKALKRFERIGYPLKFYAHSKYRTARHRNDGRTVMHFPPQYISYRQVVYDDNTKENVEWRYSKTLPSRDKDGRYEFRQIGEWYKKGTFVLKKEDSDLAFFLLYKSNMVAKAGLFYLYDEDAKNREEVDQKKKMAGLNYHIYDDTSVLNQYPARLKQVALSFGIDAANMGYDKIRLELENRVRSGEERGDGSYQRFLDAINLDELSRVRALVTRAEYDGRLKQDNDRFVYLKPDGDYGEEICKLSGGGDKRYQLASYLIDSPDILEEFRQKVGYSEEAEKQITEEENLSDIDKWDRKKLLKVAAEENRKAGVSVIDQPAKKKNSELIEAIKRVKFS
jgi:hypothetical protein